MTERELLELIVTQVGTLTKDVTEVKKDLAEVKTDLDEVKIRVIRIENDHGLKLNALFDGYKQNAEKLDRIEKLLPNMKRLF